MSAGEVIRLASLMGLRITTAESCTGGMVSAALTDIAGSSAVFTHGFVTYSNDAKHELLGVSPHNLTTYGAVSEQVAIQMADGARHAAQADLAISITGIAGPGGSDYKPEGRVCFALSQKNQRTTSETCEFGALGRPNVRRAATDHALSMVLGAVRRLNTAL